MRNKSQQVYNDNWEIYESLDEDEIICFTSVDLTYKETKDQKGFKGELFIRIRIPTDRLHGTIPIPEEQQYQHQKEEELCADLEKNNVDCKQSGRLTYNGQKQYIFEYNDLVGFEKSFNKWKNTFPNEYEIELERLKPFEYYRDILPSKFEWQQIGNRHLIEHLVQAGASEEKQHFIEHGILGKKEDLESLFNEVKNYDFSLIGMHEDAGLMEVGIKSSIDEGDITEQTDYLIGMAEEYNCQYEGWVTKIEK